MAQSAMGSTSYVFAPGHLGELTQVVPPELVDAVLEETGALERRLRCRPSRGGVYFALALGLFEHLGSGLVWTKLVVGLTSRVSEPSEKALRDLRRRIGPAPVKRLFEGLAGPLAQPSTPGLWGTFMRATVVRPVRRGGRSRLVGWDCARGPAVPWGCLVRWWSVTVCRGLAGVRWRGGVGCLRGALAGLVAVAGSGFWWVPVVVVVWVGG
ncbi:hypothetical protein GCM10011578_085460 [Streptomyces fuscichromogenes]|uniref:Transposase IS4 N-terminal domain-containing protein n=1 Tax=Streptomyces fuscichromogenes TaxID=1324013 RepID=A0A918CWE0_9ACTN|nr:hypothetical protein GCM10011578_085460 [Streptomyces fuscichromogenes]